MIRKNYNAPLSRLGHTLALTRSRRQRRRKKLAEHIKSAYEAPGGKELFWEQVPLDVFNSSYQVAILECSEQDIVEIDTYKELKAADNTYIIR